MLNKEKIKFVPLKAPTDSSDHYIQSFYLSSPQEIRNFFLKYGFVVISDILTDYECSCSIFEVYEDLKSNSFSKFDPKAENYEKVDKFVKNFGLIGGGDPVLYPQSVLNRQNEKIYQAYKYATENEYFLSAFERYGFMVPTKKCPEIQTIKNWLHIDYNPLTGKTSTFGYQPSKLHNTLTPEDPLTWQNAYFQGIVALEDCPEEVGGFHCVPGFHNFCEEWKKLNMERCLISANGYDPTTIQIDKDDDVRAHIQRIPIRKGSLLIWDGRLAHGNFPNNSEKPRLVQYLKYNAVGKNILSNVDSATTRFCEQEMEMINKVEVSVLGKKLFGLENWYASEENIKKCTIF